MAFSNPNISFGTTGLQGEAVINPTALDFSKTGNPTLFVTQQNGEIWRYEVERQADGPDADDNPDFVITSSLLISDIPQNTQNYDDDGSLNATQERQTTGLVTTTDADGNDVLYVNSSDWRVAVGVDSGLDTNSSQIHRLTLDPETGEVISNVAVLRGLPRSEENHSANGLEIAIDPDTGHEVLWIAVGANTNNGAPSNNFAGTVDSPYGGSIIKVDLTELDTYDVRTDGAGEQFILDLPTLDDPTRANVDLTTLNILNPTEGGNFTLDDNGTGGNGELLPEWAGGNNVLNGAKITDKVLVSIGGQLQFVDNPLAIHSPGFRNPYDVLITEDGEVFTWDNGPNTGWGGQPVPFSDATPGDGINYVQDWRQELATNQFNESGSQGFGDQLHYLGDTADLYGPYGGFASAIRASASVLQASFDSDGSYLPGSPSDPVLDLNGDVIFANETEARDYLSQLLIIYEEQGDGNWVDVTASTGLPSDLFDIVSGYDWAHPGNSLTDAEGFFDGTPIADDTLYSPESQLLRPSQEGELSVVGSSTNGLAEFTGTNFGGALQGAIIAASFDGNLYFELPVDSNGDGRTDDVIRQGTVGNFGSTPLAVTSLGDSGLSPTLIDNDNDGVDDFAGIVVAATYGSDGIVFLVPGEQAVPPGQDLDLDATDDIEDSHVGDPLNGLGAAVGANETLTWQFELSTPTTPPGAIPTGDSIAGDIGINAVWRNDVDFQVAPLGDPALYDPTIWNLGGASTFVSIDEADDGSAVGAANDQSNVLGIGFAAQANLEGISIESELVNIFSYTPNLDVNKTWDGGEKVGLVVGPGDQSTYVEATIAVDDSLGTIRYGLQLIVEEDDVPTTQFVEIPGIESPIRGIADPNMQIAFDFDLTPGLETVLARARYVDDGVFTPWFETTAVGVPDDVLDAIRGQFNNGNATTGAFVGLVSSADAGDDSFAASWDYVEVTGEDTLFSDAEVVFRWNAGSSTVSANDGGIDWIGGTAPIVGGPTNVFTGDITEVDASVPTYSAPIELFTQERWDPAGGEELGLEFGSGALEPGTYAVRLFIGDTNSATASIGARVFDVSIEGELFLDDFDIFATIGTEIGGMFEWTGQVTDGTVDIDFARIVENPLINAVEIIRLGDAAPATPEISVADLAASEADGTATVTFTSDVSVPVGAPVTVNFEILGASGTATPEIDYTVGGLTYDPNTDTYSGSTVIPAGQTSADLDITLIPDADLEGDETLAVRITSVTDATIAVGGDVGTVTIGDIVDSVNGVSVGDFSDDALNPTQINLSPGDTVITATQDGDPDRDYDYTTLVVAEGTELSSLTLTGFEDYDDGAANAAFIGLQAGSTFTEPASAPNPANLLGGAIFGEFDVGGDLLVDLADGVIDGAAVSTIGFTTPLPSGTYTLWWSQGDTATTSTITASVSAANGNAAPVIDPIADITIDELLVASTVITASDVDADAITLSLSLEDENGVPVTDFTFTDNSDGTGNFDWTTPDVVTSGTYTATVTASDGVNPDVTTTFDITVNDLAVSATVLYRWNAGTTTVAATDGGIDWTAGTGPIVGGPTNVFNSNITVLDPAVGPEVPLALFAQERWDPASGSELGFEFGSGALAAGNYIVRLFMSDVGLSTSQPGDRLFDVSIEDAIAFDDLDLIAEVGAGIGGVYEWTGAVLDGTIDIDFQRIIENPTINGIEILFLGDPNANALPVIISAATFELLENATSVGTVAATDVDGDALTYAIAGGVDAANFSIDPSTGALSFNAAPDFEVPTDDGADNIYDVTVSVTDGTDTVTQDIAVTVTDVDESIPTNDAPVIDPIADITIDELLVASTVITASDVDADAITLSLSLEDENGVPVTDFTFTDNSDGTGNFDWTTPDVAGPGAGTYTATVTASDGVNADVTSTFDITVNDVVVPLEGEVLYRWNAGNGTVASIDGDIDWTAGTGPIVGGPTNVFQNSNITILDASVASTTPVGLFAHERWDPASGEEIELEFGDGTLEAGNYAVRLFMGDSFAGTDQPGERVFDVSVEGELFLDDLDLAGTLGTDVGGMFEWIGAVTDGTIDIDFQRIIQNPLINGVEIIRLDGEAEPPANEAPVISAIADLTLDELLIASTQVIATDADADPIALTFALEDANGVPVTDFTFTDNGDGTGDFDWTTPDVAANSIFTATVTASDGVNAAVSTSFDVTVNDATVPTNSAPVIAAIANLTLDELLVASTQIIATDADADPIALSVALEDAGGTPVTGFTFTDNGDGTGDFDWTTPDVTGTGVFTAIVTASDGINADVTTSFDITVNDQTPPPNTAPVIDPVADLAVDEFLFASTQITATDVDVADTIALSVSLEDANGVAVTDFTFTDNGDGTGDFDWATPDVVATSVYTATVLASDGVNPDVSTTFDITVNDVPVTSSDPQPSDFDNIFLGDSSDNPIQGTALNDWIVGFEGNDKIFGGAGDDYIIAGTSRDGFVRGGTGADIFEFSNGDTELFIFDYEDGVDLIALAGGLSFADLTMTTSTFNGITTVNLRTPDGDRLRLRDEDPADITADDFIMVAGGTALV